MRAVLAALFAGALCVPGPAQDADDPREEQYKRWIADLARDDMAVREEAAFHLARAGRPAWPALERALSHEDAEVRAQAAGILTTSRRRRQLSHRLLRDHPTALEAITGGGTVDKIKLIRSMTHYYEECAPFLLDFLKESDPEVVIAASEALYDNRHYEWVEPLLRIFAAESCPRVGRVQELLTTASSMIPAPRLLSLLETAGPYGRTRLVELASAAGLRIDLPKSVLQTMLEGRAPAAQRAALAWLRDHSVPGSVPDVERLLDSSHGTVVAEALVTLRRLRHPADIDRLRSLLGHEDAGVREEALEYLVTLDDAQAAAAARRLLDDSSTSVRRVALSSLWKLRGADALEDVLRVYLEDAGEQKELAASYLLRHREWVSPRLRDAFGSPETDRRLRAVELLARIDGASVCFEAARDKAESIRLWALRRILGMDGSAANEALEALSRDTSEAVRFEALRGLVRRGKKDHVDALASYLENKEYTLRLEAAETLFDYGGDKAATLARKRLDDEDPNLRRLALGALSDRSLFGETATALDMLDDPEPRLRRAAAQYLSQAMVQKKDPAVVQSLAGKLDKLDDESFNLAFQIVTSYGDAATRPAVRKLVTNGRAPSNDRALRSLADWSGDAAIEELVAFLGDNPALNDSVFTQLSDRRSMSEKYIGRLRELLVHPKARVRASAVRAVGTLQASALGTDAAALLSDPDAEVRYAAVVACASLGLFPPALAAALDDEDPDVREKSAWAISRLRPEARPLVERAAAGEDCAWVKRRMTDLLKDWR